MLLLNGFAQTGKHLILQKIKIYNKYTVTSSGPRVGRARGQAEKGAL